MKEQTSKFKGKVTKVEIIETTDSAKLKVKLDDFLARDDIQVINITHTNSPRISKGAYGLQTETKYITYIDYTEKHYNYTPKRPYKPQPMIYVVKEGVNI